ncbi:hypothetical protein [Moraxella sp. ZY200743]|uniref:hypothetical protein n=1 Tax=Moraxella sp. ZY200743 TaxID=2911970 RepID=UPI003D7DDFFD
MKFLVIFVGGLFLSACASHLAVEEPTQQSFDKHCQRQFATPSLDDADYQQKISEYHTNTSLCQTMNSF